MEAAGLPYLNDSGQMRKKQKALEWKKAWRGCDGYQVIAGHCSDIYNILERRRMKEKEDDMKKKRTYSKRQNNTGGGTRGLSTGR